MTLIKIIAVKKTDWFHFKCLSNFAKIVLIEILITTTLNLKFAKSADGGLKSDERGESKAFDYLVTKFGSLRMFLTTAATEYTLYSDLKKRKVHW